MIVIYSFQKPRHNPGFRLFLGQAQGAQLQDLLPGDFADGGLVDEGGVRVQGVQLGAAVTTASSARMASQALCPWHLASPRCG